MKYELKYELIGGRQMPPCADPESYDRGGPTLTTFFCLFCILVDEGISGAIIINGVSLACR